MRRRVNLFIPTSACLFRAVGDLCASAWLISSPKSCKGLLSAAFGIYSCASWKLYSNFLLSLAHVQVVGACPNSSPILAEFRNCAFSLWAACPAANKQPLCWHPAGTLLSAFPSCTQHPTKVQDCLCLILSLIINKGIMDNSCSCY